MTTTDNVSPLLALLLFKTQKMSQKKRPGPAIDSFRANTEAELFLLYLFDNLIVNKTDKA